MTVQVGQIELVRDTPDDIQDRWLRVRIDDSPEEILRYGEVLSREVPPGRHRIKVHNTLSRAAVDVDVAPEETVRVRCYNHFARGGILTMLAIGFGDIKVRLEVLRTSRSGPAARNV